MVFSSIPFLYYFLPAVIISYFLVSWLVGGAVRLFGGSQRTSHKASIFTKNLILLLFSLLFYGWGEPVYVFLMIATILMFWGCGIAIGASKTQGMRLFWLIVSIVVSLGLLAYFKYTNFFIDNFIKLTGMSIPLLNVIMPIGISFYTFQCLSYTIDVYRGDVQVQKNPMYFGTYVALFPQLIAGPIVRYIDVEREINDRQHSMEMFRLGVRRFMVGLGKKILITNNIALLINAFRDAVGISQGSVLFYWMYALAFTLSIYFDFSGYSDMAIGMGKMFGFNFIENFDHPYMSKSIAEFWRRWHMSLGFWFRDYVYIPLGGNRVSKSRWVFNTLVVWLLTGMWHGANWTFILWGLLYAVCLLIEKFVPVIKKLPAALRHFYTFFLVMLGFVLFNAKDIGQAGSDIACMFGFGNLPFVNDVTLYYLRSFGVLLVVGIIGATPLLKNTANRLCESRRWATPVAILECLILIALLLICTGFLVDGSFSPFYYNNF